MKTTRMSRVNSEIQKHIAEIISKFDDSEISGSIISVLKVDTYADFSLTKIYISVLGDESKKYNIVSKLNNNKKTIRFELAHAMRFRTVPDILFVADEFEEKSQRVLKLFEKIEEDHDEN